jgi:hypothetical protein
MEEQFMRTTSRRGASRLALALVMAAGTLGGAVASTPSALAAPATSGSTHNDRMLSRLSGAPAAQKSAALAATCLDASTPPVAVACPTISSVTVGSAWIRNSTTASITYPVTVVVDDPADIVVDVDTVMGRGLDQPLPTTTVIVGLGFTVSPPAISGTSKTFTMIVDSPYLPIYSYSGSVPAYGGFQINPAVWGANPNDPALVQAWRSGTIKAQSAVTNTPSAASVRKGGAFTERGRLARFDGTPQGGQKVNVYYVPAGQTKASYAGTATTTSTGAWSLPVRSWFTGSWFVSYPGSVFSTSVYKGVWVRVS